jgi:UDP-N-acetylglucosamine--N-acetylmuramyl-(pentapeptide) pyrophosphoryl-undecaprenol N-acetylglucosamine transferase
MAPRLLIAGGGTGGHAVPALAIAEAVREVNGDSEILFIGTERGVESRIVPKAGFELEQISVISLSRTLNASLIRFPFVLAKGFIESMMIVRRFRPDLTLCTGGYVSGPVGLASALQGVPLVVHDSNVLPGITLRILSRATSLVLVGFEQARRKMGGRFQKVVGNPTRLVKRNVSVEDARILFGLAPDRTTLLVVGGSQGARSINHAVRDALPALTEAGIQVLWQTGRLDSESMAEAAEPYGRQVAVMPFIDEMTSAYRAADLAVTRAGAMTLTELNLYAIPGILVPLATSSENHQEVNARSMEREGWARMVLQRELDGAILQSTVLGLLEDPNGLAAMAKRSGERDAGDAAGRIVKELTDRKLLRL